MYQDPYRPEEGRPFEESSSYFSSYPPFTPPPVPKQKKKRFWPKALALCLICALLGGAGGIAGSFLYFRQSGGGSTTLFESDREPTVVSVSHTNTGKKLTMEEIYASWVNSTVGIRTEIVTTNVFGQQVSATAGSGFVLSSDGYIMTNYHVISGASTIKVIFADGTEYPATLVGGEESNDIAVLKIEASGLTPVILGDSDSLHVGETVAAIGNPLGELTFSMTDGIVSALNRTITMSGGAKMNMIQTNCTINSGNSGGPLFNSYGEVVGITSAKYSNNGSYSEAAIEGIGFAIPMNDVIDLVEDLIEHGYVTGKPSAGVLLSEVDDAALRYGIPDGAVITAVLDGSGAAKGGIQADDIITAVDGQEVSSVSELQTLVGKHRAGDTVTFSVYRSGETLTLTVTLDEYDQAREEAMNNLNQELYESQQQQQAQVQQPSNDNTDPSYNWPWSYGWPYGW